MGVKTGSALLLVDAPGFRRGLRTRASSNPRSKINPRRAPGGRATAINDSLRTIAPPPARMRPRVSRLEPSSGDGPGAPSAIAMSRVRHGQQNAYRCLPPGGDPGRGGARSEGRGIRLRIRQQATASREHLSRQGDAGRTVAAGGLRRIWRQPPRLPRLQRNPSRLLSDPGRRPAGAARRGSARRTRGGARGRATPQPPAAAARRAPALGTAARPSPRRSRPTEVEARGRRGRGRRGRARLRRAGEPTRPRSAPRRCRRSSRRPKASTNPARRVTAAERPPTAVRGASRRASARRYLAGAVDPRTATP